MAVLMDFKLWLVEYSSLCLCRRFCFLVNRKRRQQTESMCPLKGSLDTWSIVFFFRDYWPVHVYSAILERFIAFFC